PQSLQVCDLVGLGGAVGGRLTASADTRYGSDGGQVSVSLAFEISKRPVREAREGYHIQVDHPPFRPKVERRVDIPSSGTDDNDIHPAQGLGQPGHVPHSVYSVCHVKATINVLLRVRSSHLLQKLFPAPGYSHAVTIGHHPLRQGPAYPGSSADDNDFFWLVCSHRPPC